MSLSSLPRDRGPRQVLVCQGAARPRRRGLSVVVPVYNEAPNLEPLVSEMGAVLDVLGGAVEIVLVDDGSTDGSLDVMRGLQARDGRVRTVALARNAGQSAAMEVGFRASAFDVVVSMDADLQNDPADIPRLLDLLEQGNDAVCGIRARRRDSLVRRLSSRVANWVRSRVTRDGVVDTGCSLKAFRGEALDRLRLFNGGHRFLPALLQMEGYRVAQVPVNHRPRHAGETKYGVSNRLWRGIVDMLAVRWMQERYLAYRAEEVTP